jgi:hypothetical protein
MKSFCRYLGYRYHNRSRVYDVHIGDPVASAIDWRTKGCVNAIKDQVQNALLVSFGFVHDKTFTISTGPMRLVLGILCRGVT